MQSPQPFAHLLEELLKRRLMILAPAIICGCLGTLYAAIRSPSWLAWQALSVRDEVITDTNRTGRFLDTDSRKAAQETVIEVARNRTVVRRALEQMGPPKTLLRLSKWPSDGEVNAVMDKLRISPPDGSELGKSEVIYLSVEAKTPELAVALNQAMCDQLDVRLKEVRSQQAASILSELTGKLKLTEQNLADATKKLAAIERTVGKDLGELKSLGPQASGDSSLRRQISQIKTDIRSNEANIIAQQNLLEILHAAKDDSAMFMATPNRLLDAQPGLRRLKDGLVDSQLKVAELSGSMSAQHPAVIAAKKGEQEIREKLSSEIASAIRSIQSEIKVTNALIDSQRSQLNESQKRLDEIAVIHSGYSQIESEVAHRTEEVKQARQALANAKATQNASTTTSLITRVGGPETSDGPVGPGRITIALASWFGGLIIGLGIVFASSPMQWIGAFGPSFGRRASDRQGRSAGRRREDQVVSGPPATDRRASSGEADSSNGDRRQSVRPIN
ncbi:MAG: hypothetical protein KDA87_02635 [Planctomycetales bacterium]|nr:hypothetical protein [Planctomycetales bacterium]